MRVANKEDDIMYPPLALKSLSMCDIALFGEKVA